MIGVVLDTNVQVSANLNDEGLEAFVVSLALNKHLQLYLSTAILEEYERVLRHPRLKFLTVDIDRLHSRIRFASIVVHPTRTLSISRDEPDNRNSLVISGRLFPTPTVTLTEND